MTLSIEHLQWLDSRAIDATIAGNYGIYTGKRTKVGEGKAAHYEVAPDPSGDVLAFPTFIGGKVVGEHYRITAKKFFYQRRGSAQYFWNGSCLDDPALESGVEPLIITEGQIDALTAISVGFPFAVSMPSGAQKPPDGRLATDLDPLDPAETDRPNGRFGSLYNARAQLKQIKRIVIATDTDDAGMRLAAELVRRLGPGRCWRAIYPTGCKDLNDVAVMFGPDAVKAAITKAKPYPTKGLYRLNDFPDLGQPETYDTGWPEFDDHFRLAEGLFVPITGIPSHGKSTFVLNLAIRIAQRHPVRFAVGSFETPIKPVLHQRMLKMCLPTESYHTPTQAEKDEANAFLQDRFVFIEASDDDDAEDLTIDWMLDRFHDALMRFGIKFFILDPWNEIEHRRGFGMTQAEYQNTAIRKMKSFCRRYHATVLVCAHPTKDIWEKGKARRPSLYDIDGGSAWKNKADLGLVVHRPDMKTSLTEVAIDKAKYEHLGKPGVVEFSFSPTAGSYTERGRTESFL